MGVHSLPIVRMKTGPFGLPYSHVGQVVQAMLVCIEERGYEREDIVQAIAAGRLDETSLWDEIGPIIDRIENELFDAERLRPDFDYEIHIPKDFEVQPLTAAGMHTAKDMATCMTCGLSWDDGIVTSMTPTPSARCPFEAFHHDGREHMIGCEPEGNCECEP